VLQQLGPRHGFQKHVGHSPAVVRRDRMVAGDTEALRCSALAVRESRRWMCCRRGAVGGPARPSIQPSGCNGNGLRVPDPVAAARLHRSNTSSRRYQVRAPLCLSSGVAGGAPLMPSAAVSRGGEETPLQARTAAHAITARRSGSTVMRPCPRQQHSTGGLLASRQHRGTRSSTMPRRWQTTAIKPC
jgi:hypothetical protein